METSIRTPFDEYHEYVGYMDATVQAGKMLSYPYPGGITWEHDGVVVTISKKALANALADGAILVATSSTLALSMLPVFRWTSAGVYVNSLTIVNASDENYQYSTGQGGPRLLTRNPIEYYS